MKKTKLYKVEYTSIRGIDSIIEWSSPLFTNISSLERYMLEARKEEYSVYRDNIVEDTLLEY